MLSRKNIITGLDIGTGNIRTIIAEEVSGDVPLRVIGMNCLPSSGIRKGAVIDIEEVSRLIRESIDRSQKMAGVEAGKIILGIGGTEISCGASKGVVAVGRADGDVTEDDIRRAIGAAQTISVPPNREIIFIAPKSFRLDEKENIKDPAGMKGVRLEVDTLIIEGSVPDNKNLMKCVYQSGGEIEDVVLGVLASAKAVLNKKQKELGVIVVDMGAGTTSCAVFEEGNLVHVAIIPVGAGHITNDIAIGLRTSIDTAEKIKLEYGVALSDEVDKKEDINLADFDSQETGCISRHHVVEIIEARLEEIFDMINKKLKAIGKAGLLPAGVVLTGGGAKLPMLVDMAKEKLGLPAQIGYPQQLGGILDKVDDPSFASTVGLVLWHQENRAGDGLSYGGKMEEISSGVKQSVEKVRDWMKKFLP